MIEYLKENTWVLSIIAIGISFISVTFVIIDRLKIWRENSRNKKLKNDRAILQAIIELKVENFSTVHFKETKSLKETIYTPNYSRLYHIFQRAETSNLSDKSLALKIEGLKKLTADDLFEMKNVPNGEDFSVQFSQVVNEVISDSKKHLANIT
ncbi:MAG: hypothetical protein WKF97_15485 [Chitinophagaceae bacterium]